VASFFFFLGPPLRFIMAGDGESMLCYVVLGCYIFQWCSGAPEGLSGGGGSIPKVFRRHPVVAPSPQLLSSPIRRRSAQLESFEEEGQEWAKVCDFVDTRNSSFGLHDADARHRGVFPSHVMFCYIA
jgi:hypothetical protein